jgi:hypothetical protein
MEKTRQGKGEVRFSFSSFLPIIMIFLSNDHLYRKGLVIQMTFEQRSKVHKELYTRSITVYGNSKC